jgi:adenylate cyclase
LRTHDSTIRTSLRRHDGLEITHTGDGIEASFLAASKAVECAVAIQQAFADLNRNSPDNPIHVRIGINAGEPIVTEGRLFGTTIHTAFRICTRARPGQILASEVVYQLSAGKGFTFIDRGRAQLKGLSQRIHLYEVRWEAQ